MQICKPKKEKYIKDIEYFSESVGRKLDFIIVSCSCKIIEMFLIKLYIKLL